MLRVCGVTYDHTANYGSCLQAYAIQTAIESIKTDGQEWHYELIPMMTFKGYIRYKRIGNLKHILLQRIISRGFEKFEKKNIHHSKCKSFADLPLLNDTSDAFVCGSDVIWSPYFNAGHREYFLTFAEKYAFSYAASFGNANLKDDFLETIKPWLSRLKSIGARDQLTKEIAERLTGKQAYKVVDPVVLLSKSQWNDLANQVHNKEKNKYIFVYLTHTFPTMQNFIDSLKKMTGCKVILSVSGQKTLLATKHFNMQSPQLWLNQLLNAEYVITNSFHATVFSMMFHKKFFTVVNGAKDGGINIRMYDFLDSMGLQDRLYNAVPDVIDTSDIDFAFADAELARQREFSLKFLRDNLEAAYREKSETGR